MAESNLQDAVVLNSDTLSFRGEQLVVGSGPGTKSVVFSNDAAAMHLAAAPAANRTVFLPDAGGTIAMLTNIGLTAISAGTTRAVGGEVVFANSNGVSFGMNGNTITVTVVPGAAAGIAALAAGTQTATSGTQVFANSNGISFGMSGSTQVTASIDAIKSISAGTTRATGGEVVWSNSNNVSFGLNGNTITATITVPAQVPFGVSAGTQSVSTGTLVFSNSNGVTFGMSGSNQITASVSSVVFSNSNNVTFGLNGATLTASVTVAATAETPFGVSAGTQSVSTGTMVFSNSNNVSFGMSGSSRITASASFPAETPFGVSAGTQSVSTGTLVFSNSNGVTFGMSGSSQVTASFSQTVQPAINAAAGTQTATSGTVVWANSNGVTFGMSGSTQVTASFSSVVFSNSNNVSFGINAGTLTATATFAGGGGGAAISAGTQSVSTGTVAFANSNGVTFGMSNSNQVTASIDAIKSISAGTTRATGGEVVFSNSNGVSFGLNGNTITATVVPGAAAGIGAIAAGTQTATSGTQVFANSNGISFGMSGSSQVTASADYVRSISAGTTNATGNQLVFADSNGISWGANGATITAIIRAVSDWLPYQMAASSNTSFGQNSISFLPLIPQMPVVMSGIEMLWSVSHSSTSTPAWSHGRTLQYGLYIESNGTVISLLSSSSFVLSMSGSSNLTYGLTLSQGTNSTAISTAASGLTAFNQAGFKIITLPFVATINPIAPYYFGYKMSSASSGANVAQTLSYLMNNEVSNASIGAIGPTGLTASNKSIVQEPYGFIFSVSSANLPGSIGMSDISIQSNTQPYLYFEG